MKNPIHHASIIHTLQIRGVYSHLLLVVKRPHTFQVASDTGNTLYMSRAEGNPFLFVYNAWYMEIKLRDLGYTTESRTPPHTTPSHSLILRPRELKPKRKVINKLQTIIEAFTLFIWTTEKDSWQSSMLTVKPLGR